MRKLVATLMAASLLFLCSCSAIVKSVSEKTPKTGSAAQTQSTQPVQTLQPEAPVKPAEPAKPEDAPKPAEPAQPEPPKESAAHAKAVAVLLERVPGLAEYVDGGILSETGSDENAEVNGIKCVTVDYKGEFELCDRSFAVSYDGNDLFEYDSAGERWILRDTGLPAVSLEETRTMLSSVELLAGFAFVGEGRVDRSAYSSMPFLGAIGGEAIIDTGAGDWFVVVPADEDAFVAVQKGGQDDAHTVFHSEKGDPVIVTADPGDDSVVVVIQSGERTLYFTPQKITSIMDTEHNESAYNFGPGEYLPMGGNSAEIISRIVERKPGYADPELSLEIRTDETADIYARRCWLVDIGTYTQAGFVPQECVAVSEDYRHVYFRTETNWNEMDYFYPIKACFGYEAPQFLEQVAEFKASETEPTSTIIYQALEKVTDVRVLSLFMTGVDDNGQIKFDINELYKLDSLRPGEALAVVLTFIGDMPNNGIAVTDKFGNERFFSVGLSGMDGSVQLIEFEG